MIINLICFINGKQDLVESISYPILPAPIHEVASCIFKIDKEEFMKIQLHFIQFMKTSMLWKENPTLAIDFCNKMSNSQYALFNYVMKQNFPSEIIEISIIVTFELYNDSSLNDKDREMILLKCISMLATEVDKKSMKKLISAWVLNSLKIIHQFGIDYFHQILPIIPQSSLTIANEALSSILIIGSADIANKNLIQKGIENIRNCAANIKKSKFKETRNLSEVIQEFRGKSNKFLPYKSTFDGSPVNTLSENELAILEVFGRKLEKQPISINIEEEAIIKGKAFRDNPSIDNAVELVCIVRQTIQEVFGINPFIVQCLTVAAMLLHRINKNIRNKLKGRIAQVATGEGKSIIVAMLASCIALTGSFVDVVSSSLYLAKRDATKYNKFYEKLGLRCGFLLESSAKYDFDYHIIYSTNLGFEFALLREGISGKTWMESTPLYENVKRKRNHMTAIVDEADNLFIDVVINIARICHKRNSKRTWIFKPIFQSVCKKIFDPIQIREIMKRNINNDEQFKELESISNEYLIIYIQNAIRALKLQKDVHYVVGKDEKTGKSKILIVDVDNTGRIMYNNRWTNGLHEFVELKEGIPIMGQNYTIASISHPSFFKQYEEIFGLTGTLGEESERKEILEVYRLDSFDVPPNKKCLRKREKTLIVSTEEVKNSLIIEQIKRIINEKRSILIIVYSIEDSQKLSLILRKEKIDHFILNGRQSQDEDFIINHTGLPGSVTIATNTAGRGTDIHVDEFVLKNGGLHTLVTFWPSNLRVECQAFGRSARQGQKGSCQLLFVSDKINSINAEPSEETLENIYNERSNENQLKSIFRMNKTNYDDQLYFLLKQFFSYINQLSSFLESTECQSILKSKYSNTSASTIINELSSMWAQFYSKLLTLCKNEKVPLFDTFLDQWSFDKKFPFLADHFVFSFVDKNNEEFSNENDSLGQLTSLGYDKNLCKNALDISIKNVNDSIKILSGSQMIKTDKNIKRKVTNEHLETLISMGFDRNICEEALQFAKNDINVAISLLLNEAESHENEKKKVENIDVDLINQLNLMGFDRELCRKALVDTDNNFEKALNWLLNEKSKKEDFVDNQNLQINTDVFGDLKPYYEQLTKEEKLAISRLLDTGSSPYEVLQMFLICQKDEKATKDCLS